MKRYLTAISLLTVLLVGGVGAGAIQQDSSSRVSSQKTATNNKNSQTSEATGEEIFQANCARCHMPPMTISQRVTGTIIMHMRVRARLSRQDEQQLLKYLAP